MFCVWCTCTLVLCSLFDISVLSCCVLCCCICTLALCSVHLGCMDAGAREKLVHSFSIKRNLIPSKPHHNQLMCNELADSGSNLLIFFVGLFVNHIGPFGDLIEGLFELFNDPCDMGHS